MELDLSKYNRTNDWFVYSEIRNNLLKYISANDIHKILEIGSFEGISSCCFSDNLLNHPDSFLVCVDPFCLDDTTTILVSETEKIFNDNMLKSKHFDKCIIHKTYSNNFFKDNEKTFNLIYIDGSHDPDDIKLDMEESFKCLEKGGIMWMDDYLGGGSEKLIKKTMDEFLEKHIDKYELIHKGYQLAIRKL